MSEDSRKNIDKAMINAKNPNDFRKAELKALTRKKSKDTADLEKNKRLNALGAQMRKSNELDSNDSKSMYDQLYDELPKVAPMCDEDIDEDIKLEYLSKPDIINEKPSQLVETYLRKQDSAAIENILRKMSADKVSELDARILWVIRDSLKKTHPNIYKKGSWWYIFIAKYAYNNFMFILLFGLCTVLPTYLASLVCQYIYGIETPDYMIPHKANTREEQLEEMEAETDPDIIIETAPPLVDDGDGDIDMDGPPPPPAESGIPMGRAFMVFASLTALFTILLFVLVCILYYYIVPLCYHRASTNYGFTLIPNSPIILDMNTLLAYLVGYNILVWIHLLLCMHHYLVDTSGEIGAALIGLPAGMIPPPGGSTISNNGFYNVMTFSRFLVFTVLTIYIMKPLIIYNLTVETEWTKASSSSSTKPKAES